MTSFVLNTTSTLPRVLNPGEIGRIDPSGFLVATNSASPGGGAVTMNGAAYLQNFGQIQGLGLSSVHVAAPGAMIQNIGTITHAQAYAAAIAYTATVGSADLSLLNVGTIRATGEAGRVFYAISGGINITNTGLMLSTAGECITIGWNGTNIGSHIINSGTIQAGSTSEFLAINMVGNEDDLIENAGLIRGSIEMGDGDDTIINAGHLSSSQINLGRGDDVLVSTGLIERMESGQTVVASLGTGHDTLDVSASDGRMVVFGGLGDDHFITSRNVNLLVTENANEGIDTLETDAANALLPDFVENLILYGTGVNGTGNGLDNALSGSEIANVLLSAAGNDTLFGNGGNDTLISGDNDDRLFGGANDDQLLGEAAKDTLFGGTGNDMLIGGGDIDSLSGDAGNDTLVGGDGADVLIGGEGTRDMASYFDAASALRADLLLVSANTGDAAGDTYAGVEDLLGSNRNDTMLGDNGANIVDGWVGDDHLFGRAGNDTLIGNFGNDTLEGGAGADLLDGGGDSLDLASYQFAATAVRADLQTPSTNTGEAAGDSYFGIDGLVGSGFNDTLVGNTGNNFVQGGNGEDLVFGGGGNDTVFAESGNDTLLGGEGDDFIGGLLGDDSLVGGAGNDSLFGEQGDDISHGEAGNDVIRSFTGNDTLFGGEGFDFLDGQDNDDFIGGGNDNDTLLGGAGNDRLFGEFGDDSQAGDAGNDLLRGFVGNDTLDGGTGNDIIDGGAGVDRLSGGIGADRFDFTALGDSGVTAATRDVITDFQTGVDDLFFTGLGLSVAPRPGGGIGGDFTGVAGQLIFRTAGGNGFVEVDANGDRAADFSVQLTGVTALSPADLLL